MTIDNEQRKRRRLCGSPLKASFTLTSRSGRHKVPDTDVINDFSNLGGYFWDNSTLFMLFLCGSLFGFILDCKSIWPCLDISIILWTRKESNTNVKPEKSEHLLLQVGQIMIAVHLSTVSNSLVNKQCIHAVRDKNYILEYCNIVSVTPNGQSCRV